MTIQQASEQNGWHFDDTGAHVIVGRKNVTLKDGHKGCVTVSPDLLNICSTQDVAILYGDYNDLMTTYGIDHLYHWHIGEVKVSECGAN